ncbi:MAG TPA: hypothetical protein VG738_20980 [Chitinophagaceae bacterium]|nr:hypothetical protein [Chitinophagaceae bacterium]
MISSLINSLFSKKPKRKRLTYEDYIIRSAPDFNKLSITAVNDIEIIKTLPLEEQLYAQIAALIKEGDIEAVKNMAIDENVLEDLTLVRFVNQLGEPYAAIVYDSYEVWQEPIVVEVFKL